MNSYRQNERTGRRKLLAATALVIFLFAADVLSGGKIRDALRVGAASVVSAQRSISSYIGGDILTSRSTLAAQNQVLQSELTQMQDKVAADEALRQENEQLRSLMHLASTSPGVAASVVSTLGSSPYGTLLLSAGSAQGIRKDDLVLTPGWFVAGIVSDVSVSNATVRQIFAPETSIDVSINGATVTLQGQGGSADLKVPRGVPVSLGDTVIAPGLGQRPVGVVGAISSSTAGATSDVFVALPTALSALPFVYVIHAN